MKRLFCGLGVAAVLVLGIALGSEMSAAAGKAIYEYLAGLERGHFNLLMLNYDNLANAGRFLGAQA